MWSYNIFLFEDTLSIKLDENCNTKRVGGVRYTIKDGIVYDAKQLLKDVKNIVDKAKADEKFVLKQPGIE